MPLLLLYAMVFCHIVDDYYLQGILAKMKQKSWWEDNCPDEQYKHDYLAALAAHGFSWSFMINLPVLIFLLYKQFSVYQITIGYTGALVWNVFVHMFFDDLKANKKSINLCQDQVLHLIQLVGTYFYYCIAFMK